MVRPCSGPSSTRASQDCDTGPDGIGAPMPVYCVRFDPQTLWDKKTETGFSIYADLFEHYLGDAVTEAA
jgi:nitrile hydratase